MREAEGYWFSTCLFYHTITYIHLIQIQIMACERYGVMVRGVMHGVGDRQRPIGGEPDGRHQVESLSLYLALVQPRTASHSLLIESHSYSSVKVGVLLFYSGDELQRSPMVAVKAVFILVLTQWLQILQILTRNLE